jgi:nicotinate-nucleotide pyrophosphorylase (carboxylating)
MAVSAALREDRADDDLTSAWSVPEGLSATAEIRTRHVGVAAGIPLVAEVYARIDPRVEIRTAITDGCRVGPGESHWPPGQGGVRAVRLAVLGVKRRLE